LVDQPHAKATLLHYAAFCGMHDVMKFLIVDYSQDVNVRGLDKKETPLHVASRHGRVDVVQLLLEHGADVDARARRSCSGSSRTPRR
jgi:ankyrin repeat protein